jgi:peptidase E
MTKYVLNSGGMRNNVPESKKFIAEIIKSFDKTPKILFCFFAEKREDWDEKFNKYQVGFNDLMPKGVKPQYLLAFPDVIEEQISNADIIYLHGGDDDLIQYRLSKFNIPEIWEGKVVATNSASSNAIATASWTCDWRNCIDGLGVLPIKFISHYNSNFGANDPRGSVDWEKAKKELEEYGDKSLPIYALEEGEFEVFEV